MVLEMIFSFGSIKIVVAEAKGMLAQGFLFRSVRVHTELCYSLNKVREVVVQKQSKTSCVAVAFTVVQVCDATMQN